MKRTQTTAESDKYTWEIDALINWINEQKSLGATHLDVNGDYDGGQLVAYFDREETEEEILKREVYKNIKVKIKYRPKMLVE
jgi:hypothetical protein